MGLAIVLGLTGLMLVIVQLRREERQTSERTSSTEAESPPGVEST